MCESGAAHIFRYDGTTWVEEAKLTLSNGEDGEEFGYSVALHGNRALISAPSEDNRSGTAYIFRREDTTWVEEARLAAPPPAAVARFGHSVSLLGSRALIGAPFENVGSDQPIPSD